MVPVLHTHLQLVEHTQCQRIILRVVSTVRLYENDLEINDDFGISHKRKSLPFDIVLFHWWSCLRDEI